MQWNINQLKDMETTYWLCCLSFMQPRNLSPYSCWPSKI